MIGRLRSLCRPALHRLTVEDDLCLVFAAPAVEDIVERDRAWGLSVALYGLRSTRNLGIGDYRDLADAAERTARLGADFIGINPVHARGTAGDGVSPYSPTCRTALEPGHIAPDAVPGFGDCAEVHRILEEGAADLEAEKAGDLIDYRAHERRQRKVLQALFRAAIEAGGPAAADLAAWRRGPGRALEWFAVFEAIAEVHGPDWRTWPEALRAAGSPDVRRLAAQNERAVRYHAWLQWLADRQLADARAAARGAGMAFGLYLDLAAGVLPGGADTWAAPACFARGVSLGAPPDAFSPDGQTWNLAPFTPPGLRAAAYEPFVRMLRAAMAHAGIVRIDHVLGLDRGFWVPERGAPGGYVRYPLEPLLALVRIEAARAGCIVVGEDLGSVPAGLRRRLAGSGMPGCCGDAVRDRRARNSGRPGATGPPASPRPEPTTRRHSGAGGAAATSSCATISAGPRRGSAPRRSPPARRSVARSAACWWRKGTLRRTSTPPRRRSKPMTRPSSQCIPFSPVPAPRCSQSSSTTCWASSNSRTCPARSTNTPTGRRRYPVTVEALADDPGLAAIASVVGSRGDYVSDRKPLGKQVRQWA